MAPILVETIERNLVVKLTKDELLVRASLLSRECSRLREIQNDQATMRAECKARIEECEGQVERLSNAIATESEVRKVGCAVMHYPTERRVDVVRMDTGEVAESRRMTDSELQTQLPLGAP